MSRRPGHPLLGHGLILAALVASLGVTQAVLLEPRGREVRSLRADEQRLGAQLLDLTRGLEDMKAWAAAHPGEDLLTFRARRALPEREMVPAFLKAVAPLADRHGIRTGQILPVGGVGDESVTDAAGRPVAYRRAELRLRVHGDYRNLGEYLRGIETLDQLVIVRSVSVRQNAPTSPSLAADVTVWVHGTP